MAFLKTSVRLDAREFHKAMKALTDEFPKKDFPEFLNKRAFYVARKAVWYTPTADYLKFAAQLGKSLTLITTGKRAGTYTKKGGHWQINRVSNTKSRFMPLAGVIINSRLVKKGLPTLRGKELKVAMEKMLGARARSIGFLKAGWTAARDALQSSAGLGGKGYLSTRGSGSIKPSGVRKALGGAKPAGQGMLGFFKTRVLIWNQANAKRDHKEALKKYAAPAIQRALDEEAAEMRGHLAKKIEERARRAQIRVQNNIAESGTR